VVVKEKLTVQFVWMERKAVSIVTEVVGTTVFSVKTEETTAKCARMVLAMNVMEPAEIGYHVGHAVEAGIVPIAVEQVAQHATILGIALIVTEQVRNCMHAGHVMEQVNATTVTDKDGKHALTVMVKAEKTALNVVGMA